MIKSHRLPLWSYWFTAGIFLRLPYLWGAQVLQTEGTTYVTLARHLLAGQGYIGILGEKELVMVSALPWFIAGLGKLGIDLVIAGRLVSLLAGAGIVALSYLWGETVFADRWAGHWAALLVAMHPFLGHYAVLVRVESVFTLFWLLGIYATWQALQHHDNRRWPLLMATAFGVAYLLKSEGAVYFAVSWFILAAIGLWQRRPWRGWLTQLALSVALFLLLAAPMVIWLSAQTGRLTVETKGIINFSIGKRIAAGMDYQQAAYGLNPDATAAGPLLHRNALVLAGAPDARPSFLERSRWSDMLVTLREEARILWSELLAPLVWLFVLLGWAYACRRRCCAGNLFLLLYAAIAYLGISTILFVWTRYLFPIVPLAALWAGAGLAWFQQLPQKWWGGRRWVPSAVTAFLTLLLLFSMPLTRQTWRHLTVVPDRTQKAAGEWLRQSDPNPAKRVMSKTSQVPFYSDGVHLPMPDAAPDLVARYAKAIGAEYVVVSAAKDGNRPYKIWLDPRRAPAGWQPLPVLGQKGTAVVIYALPRGH